MKKVIVNWRTAEMGFKNQSGEVNDQPSMTVPDQVLSLPEMLKRYASGQQVPLFEGTYHDEELPDLNRLDTMERIDLARELKESISEAQANLAAKRTKRAADAAAKKAEKADPPKDPPKDKPKDSPSEQPGTVWGDR